MGRLFPAVSARNVLLVLRPRAYIAAQPLESGIAGRLNRGKRLAYLAAFFLFNLAVLVAPLFFSNVAGELVAAHVALAGITFWVFHGSLVVTGNGSDVITTFRSVVYCTGVYLSAFLSMWLLYSPSAALAPLRAGATFRRQVTSASEFLVRSESSSYVSYLLDLGPVFLLALAFGYYVYSLYLAAHLRHGVSRVGSVWVAVVSVALPVFLAASGSVLFSGTGGRGRLESILRPIARTTNYGDPGLLVLGGILVVLLAVFANHAVIKSYQ